MRITFFVHRFWPSVGGVEKYIEQLSRALLAMGHGIDIVAGAHLPELPEHEMVKGLRVHRFPALRSPLRCRAWFWRHLRLFRQADVISVSNTHMLEYFWRMLGPAVSVNKVFLIRHGMKMAYPVPEQDLVRARQAQRLAAGVAHDGRFIGQWLGVQPDICPEQGLSPTADELPFAPEPPPDSAAFLGRLEPDTGIHVYMDAVSLFTRGNRSTFRLDVYGDGSLLPQLRARVEAERLPVVFRGPRADAQELLPQACFAFVDGRMAIQEAMARRRLVFSAYTNPLKRDYLCGEPFSPFLEAVGSATELASRLGHYIRNAEERQRKVEAAYQYSRRLSWTCTAQEYVAFWKARLTATTLRPLAASR